jgi:hypothetical protein
LAAKLSTLTGLTSKQRAWNAFQNSDDVAGVHRSVSLASQEAAIAETTFCGTSFAFSAANRNNISAC